MKLASLCLTCKIRYVEKRIDFITFYKVLTTVKNKLNRLFNICLSLSFGIIFGGIVGVITKTIKKKVYTEKQMETIRKIWKTGSHIMTYITCLFLVLSFIWCIYFLILGIVYPNQAEYANTMSELIASVVTVISIAFAFYEFIRKK